VPVVASGPVCVRVCVGLEERRPMRMRMSVVAVVVAVIRGRIGEAERGAGRAVGVVVRNGDGARVGEVQRRVEAEGRVGGHWNWHGHSDGVVVMRVWVERRVGDGERGRAGEDVLRGSGRLCVF
jgi:hypothetical protein